MNNDMCGPSNALKGLADHVDQDRSRQQDRLASGPQNAGQGFRSVQGHDAAAGHFAAFQNGNVALPGEGAADMEVPLPGMQAGYAAHLYQFHPPQPVQPVRFDGGSSGDWAADFEQMNLNQPQPGLPGLQQSGFHPMMGPHAMVQGQPPMLQSNQVGRPMSPMVYHRPEGYVPYDMLANFGMPYATEPHFDTAAAYESSEQHPSHLARHHLMQYNLMQHNLMQQQQAEMDDQIAQQQRADMDEEFDNAMAEWMNEHGPTATAANGSMEEQMQATDDLVGDATTTATLAVPAHELGTEQAQDAAKDGSADAGVDEAFAQAAQELVNAVSDNESDKFKNSKFLQIMRRAANRELVVQGDELVEANKGTSATPDVDGKKAAE
ncbi:hypothetical protein GGR56DRAFT_637167 [Xylariaceae sp. FL0804]|nr:hypothetical protein GGR56DRAFT_637167 [Xylariaceae sp. FL0804]